MGGSYSRELKELTSTYKRALLTEIDRLVEFVSASRSLPLVAIGSGGSLTAAVLASLLHEKTGMISQYLTPLEFVSSSYDWRDKSIILLSAKGGNSDIIASLKTAIKCEPRQLTVLCARKGSPMGRIARRYSFVNVFESEPPRRDGFLATNSLLTFFVLLIRAYTSFFRLSSKLPESLESFVRPDCSLVELLSDLKGGLDMLLHADTFVVLYGKWGKPASLDLESKFTEAALGNVQLADYRNFAHGRHYWLAERPHNSGIVSFVTPDDQLLARKTLSLIPEKIPTAIIRSPFDGPVGALGLLVNAMFFVGALGGFHGVDPGKPQIPHFGRKLYHLGIPLQMLPRGRNPLVKGLPSFTIKAIRRKMPIPIDLVTEKEIIDFWVSSYKRFLDKIEQNSYDAVIFDYDGTLCESRERFLGLSRRIGRELVRLIENGVFVGIATGRGRSVRKDLEKMVPQEHRSRVMVGYYNGSQTGLLSDSTKPVRNTNADPLISALTDHFEENEYLSYISAYECRPRQITFTPKGNSSMIEIESTLDSIARRKDLPGIEILESDHSIDLLAPGVCKLSVLAELKKHLSGIGKDGSFLCIGDKGRWPGNDFYLLSTEYSLSVDTVSSEPDTCWNLALDGHRGVQATLDYLGTAECKNERMHLNLRRLARG